MEQLENYQVEFEGGIMNGAIRIFHTLKGARISAKRYLRIPDNQYDKVWVDIYKWDGKNKNLIETYDN